MDFIIFVSVVLFALLSLFMVVTVFTAGTILPLLPAVGFALICRWIFKEWSE
ncbi:MAG: hypothetical protein K2H46_02445 [Muribaculaceae bacterium]|nr:hypothetical protein [Muribaculaceae bacterium]